MRAGVRPQQFSEWLREDGQKPPKVRLATWAQREGWSIDMFAEGGPRPAEVFKDVQVRVREEGRSYRYLDEFASVDGPGWQFDSQLSDDELVELMQHDRPGFIRYLQSEWGGRPLPLEAKNRRLDWLVKKAAERGLDVDIGFVAWIRDGIRQRSL